jgi:hypothetical protein
MYVCEELRNERGDELQLNVNMGGIWKDYKRKNSQDTERKGVN